MDKFLETIYEPRIDESVGKGKGTGLLSKVLSWVSLLVLTALLAVLIKHEHYIVALLAVALFVNYVNVIMLLAAIAYFIYVQYWIGVILAVCYSSLTTAAMIVGRSHAKKLIIRGKPIIGPFEGMPDIVFLWILQCGTLAFALLLSGTIATVSWVLFALLTLYLMGRLSIRVGEKWRRIHYPLMMRYAGAAGLEAGMSKSTGRPWDINKAVGTLLKTVYPHKTEEDINESIGSIWEKRRSLSDLSRLRSNITQMNPNISKLDLDQMSEKIAKWVRDEEANDMAVRYAIAHVVEDLYGPEERDRYLLALFTGKAN
jgi:hypothetical protein